MSGSSIEQLRSIGTIPSPEKGGPQPSHQKILIGHRKTDRIQVGDIELNTRARMPRRRNRLIDLTSVEFDLLALFLNSPGEILGREELTKVVLGREFRANDRCIDVHVSNLRRKLGPSLSGGERIKNIRSTGYLYVALP
jgi:two-component system response regulator CpxR